MERMGKFISAIGIWALLVSFFGITNLTFFGVRFNTAIGVIFSLLCLLMPKTFDMGVTEWGTANVLEKMLPIVTVILLLLALRIAGQSYATLVINSLFIGELVTYIGKFVGSLF